jgi:hypothetical protein
VRDGFGRRALNAANEAKTRPFFFRDFRDFRDSDFFVRENPADLGER